jgi:ABC-type nickel/cobalt efflux system permease component RcnA
MNREILVLAGTAASLGFIHTLIGPDHYLPFIFIGRARRWSLRKVLAVSFLAGLGHILSSVVLGLLGIGLGIAVMRLENVESARGEVAAWLLIGFGLAYFLWGLRSAWKKRPHEHRHVHGADEAAHAHVHTHEDAHMHLHPDAEKKSLTPWILFTIFVFGPCEPLIPLIMYPAAKHSTAGVVLVTAAFGLTTIGTMLVMVAAVSYGASLVRLGRLERYAHAMAGVMILVSGLVVMLLGL